MDDRPDVLEDVLIESGVLAEWQALARRHRELYGAALSPASEERAYLNGDGSLVVYIDVPGLPRLELRVKAGRWYWKGGGGPGVGRFGCGPATRRETSDA